MAATVAVVMALAVGGCSSGGGDDEGDDDQPASSPLCEQVYRQGELRSQDITDPDAIAALVAVLPPELRLDAALFYFPYGGPIPRGTDTSGNAAMAAGGRLHRLYRAACGYHGV